MNNRYLLEEQTGHPRDPGDVKWQLIERFIHLDSAQGLARVLSQQASYAETDLRIYDLEEDKVIWSNLSPELKRRILQSELNELKIEADEEKEKENVKNETKTT